MQNRFEYVIITGNPYPHSLTRVCRHRYTTNSLIEFLLLFQKLSKEEFQLQLFVFDKEDKRTGLLANLCLKNSILY